MLHHKKPDENSFQRAYRQHIDAVYRVCFGFLKNESDAEDAAQETFLRFYRAAENEAFESESHEKAWLIVTASNICKNTLNSWTHTQREDADSPEELLPPCSDTAPDNPVLDAVLSLPDKYKTAIYMYYYEDYSCTEIAKAMGKRESGVKSLLKRGRALLEKKINRSGGEADEK